MQKKTGKKLNLSFFFFFLEIKEPFSSVSLALGLSIHRIGNHFEHLAV